MKRRESLAAGTGQPRKAENARPAPTTTGGIVKRALFALEGDSEVVEELAFVAGHQKSGGVWFRV
ncbi:hypothetical protein D8M03_07420 [Lysinibacillus endophyticus]|uniref:Uncharacterized protein n=1 Tax=Ureibacillus endophyticus TaxID=1978490 RepID=A0A494Z5X0_9BACL|nr:hypothetical protein D8M03_07420 [Lysinibacillus endophyticus]